MNEGEYMPCFGRLTLYESSMCEVYGCMNSKGNDIYVYMNSLVSVRVTWWDEIHESLVSVQVSWWDEIHGKPCEHTGDMVIPNTWIALWAYGRHVEEIIYMRALWAYKYHDEIKSMKSLVSVRVTWWYQNTWIALWAYGWHVGITLYMKSLVSIRVTCQINIIHEEPCESTDDMIIFYIHE